VARLWGCQIAAVRGQRGVMDPDDVRRRIRDTGDVHYPRTSVLSLEDTHNYAGGAVLPLECIDVLTSLAREHGLAVHMDGARVFNAEVASGVAVDRITRDVDLGSVCLSKGLGAPVGSVVVGSAERIGRCRKLRKGLGGGMRQVGVIAAAGLLALREGPALLAEDHRRARALAELLDELPGVDVDLEAVHTNVVIARTSSDAAAAERGLAERGVLALHLDPERLRFVFHRDVGDEAVLAAAEACRALFD